MNARLVWCAVFQVFFCVVQFFSFQLVSRSMYAARFLAPITPVNVSMIGLEPSVLEISQTPLVEKTSYSKTESGQTASKNATEPPALASKQDKDWLQIFNGGMTVRPPKVFWFIATHHGGEKSKQAVMSTWGKRVELHWYTDVADPALGKNCHVITVPEGESYNNIFFKMMLIWEHIYANYPNYDYYFRLWQDNYVIVDRVLLQLMRWDPYEKPIVLANIGPFMQDTKAPGTWEFLGGGPGWAVGNLALKILAEKGQDCRDRIAKADNFGCKHWCEDVLISWCLRAYEVEFIPACGWFGHPPENQYSCGIQPQQLACGKRLPIRDCPAGRMGECRTATDFPGIFHYVGAEDMMRIEDIVYRTKCEETP